MLLQAHQVVAESRYHEELLQNAVHITDAAEVPEAHVLLVLARTGRRHVVPALGLLDSRDQRLELGLQESLHECRAVLDQLVEELVGCLAALVVLYGGLLLVFARTNLLLDKHGAGVG